MKNNFFKSYYSAYGIVSTIIFIIASLVIGYVCYLNKTLNLATNLTEMATGICFVLLLGCAVLGLTKLGKKEICLIDFLRVVALFGGIILFILAFLKGHTKHAAVYGLSGGLCLIETIIRLVVVDDQTGEISSNHYFSAIANKYNPMIILFCSAILATALTIVADKFDVFSKFNIDVKSQEYLILGCGAGAFIAILLPSFVKDSKEKYGASIFDLILTIMFLTSLFMIVLIPAHTKSYIITKLMILIFCLSSICLIIKGIIYGKNKDYIATNHKVRTYFLQIFERYDASLLLVGTCILVLFFGILAPNSLNEANFIIALTNNKHSLIGVNFIFQYIAIVFGLLFIVLILSFNKFRSKDIVKTDAVLVTALSTTIIAIPYLVLMFIYHSSDFMNNKILLAIIALYVVVFLFAFIVQCVRIKNYDVIALIAEEAKKREKAKAKVIIETVEENKEEPAEDTIEESTEEETDNYLGYDDELDDELVEDEEVLEDNEEITDDQVEKDTEVVEEPETVEETPVEVVETTEDSEEDIEELEDEEEDDAEEDTSDEELEDEVESESDEEVTQDATKDIQVQEYVALDENGAPKKIRKKFNTKMMYAPYETKEYYNEVKNYLEMYRGKGRISARCETFRYKGLMAKVALGGKSLKVYLALDPEVISQYPKYHFTDCSLKKQYAEVPVMIKVRSNRGLKYFKELVDMMMQNREIKPKRKFEPTNYLPTLIPNGEAILANLGLSRDYLQDMMNTEMIPDEMPTDLEEYLPVYQAEELTEEEVEASVYLDTLCNHFNDGDVIDIDVLKSMHIVTKGNVIHVKARGTMDRKLTIYAEYFDEDALQILMCLSCTAVKVSH